MEKLLTIVVPAYNVEKYIKNCLDSFIDLSVLRSLEILIVDDGSTDSTASLAHTYEQKYPYSFKVLSKENGGHGSTINLVDDRTKKVTKRRKAVSNSYHYNREWGFAEAVMDPLITIHSMTIRTDVLQKNDIRMDEHCFYEDQEYILYPIPYCTSITFSPLPLYQYRLGRSGQSVDIKMMIKRHDQHLKVLDALFEYNNVHGNLQTYKKQYLERGIAEAVDDEYQIFLAKGNDTRNVEQMKKFDEMLREEHPGVYQACSRKSVWMLRKTGFKIFPMAAWVYSRLRGN